MLKREICFGTLTLILATPAHAYIGPGAGAGTIAVVLGIITSIFLAFVAVLWYPLKRLFRVRKAPSKVNERTQAEEK